ncbi:hypothetical protein M378DRAFT_596023 [Amanita muscaria Koide BX008]|uniref:Secreted protein n=1 Tax=Amanita muscaria (strain Koide BX008) TaxID=946122 RepID=A0A0C2SMB8_AMAMK|nr:hypothetical protein M378DRAFT_596023 [Amanita muscaria Koide BX008]
MLFQIPDLLLWTCSLSFTIVMLCKRETILPSRTKASRCEDTLHRPSCKLLQNALRVASGGEMNDGGRSFEVRFNAPHSSVRTQWPRTTLRVRRILCPLLKL